MDLLQELALVKLASNRADNLRDGQFRQWLAEIETKDEITRLRTQIAQQNEETRRTTERQSQLLELQVMGRTRLCDCDGIIDQIDSYDLSRARKWVTLALIEHILETAKNKFQFTSLDDIRFIKSISDKLNPILKEAQIGYGQSGSPLEVFKKQIPYLNDLLDQSSQLLNTGTSFDSYLEDIEEINNEAERAYSYIETLDERLEEISNCIPAIYLINKSSGFDDMFDLLMGNLASDGLPLSVHLLDSNLRNFIFKQGTYYSIVKSNLKTRIEDIELLKKLYIDDCEITERCIKLADSFNYRAARLEIELLSSRFPSINKKCYNDYIFQIKLPLDSVSVLLHKVRLLAQDRRSILRSPFILPKRVDALKHEYEQTRIYFDSLPSSELRYDLTPFIEEIQSHLGVIKS